MMKKKNVATPWYRNVLGFIRTSTWAFPIAIVLILAILTVCKLNGSSIGIYHSYFYGNASDHNLLLNKPRPIRSDEWLVNTQMAMAQSNNDLNRTNQNIGNGEDMSVILDVPVKDWSTFFKPHNWAFFALPFDYAFAFKWWFMGCLLVISCYFFVLRLMPDKKWLAILLSLSLLYAPFTQWWYQYVTLGSMYYSLFIALAFTYLLKATSWRQRVVLGTIICYLGIAFALLLYPPFQIACALVLVAFCIGYFLEQRENITFKQLIPNGLTLGIAAILAGTIVGLFLMTRSAVVSAVRNTAYPGQRIVESGGYNAAHLLSGQFSFPLQFGSKALHYQLPQEGITNQSEAANFILFVPYLLLPSAYLLYAGYRAKRKFDWPLFSLSVLTVLLAIRLFIPHTSIFFKPLLLSVVPQNRLIIGIGLLSFFYIVLFIRHLSRQSRSVSPITQRTAILYSAVCGIVTTALAVYTVRQFHGFISPALALLCALPIPVVIYLLLRRSFILAVGILTVFTVISSMGIHPLYRGTAALTQTPLSKHIKSISQQQPGRWAVESIYLENIALDNGAPSLSGVYTYPQFSLWLPLNDGRQEDIYNRYAHVGFEFDRNLSETIPSSLNLEGGDHFVVKTEPCSNYLRTNNVRFLLTEQPLQDSCAHLIKAESYPARTVYIYELR